MTYLKVQKSDSGLKIALEAPVDFRSHQRGKMKRGERAFRRTMNGLGGVECMESDAGICYRIVSSDGCISPSADDQIAQLKARLSALYDAPISPRTIEKVLNISADERRRWTKDGRLPSADRQTIDRGGYPFSISTYPPQLVAELEANPHIIAEWRQRDKKTP